MRFAILFSFVKVIKVACAAGWDVIIHSLGRDHKNYVTNDVIVAILNLRVRNTRGIPAFTAQANHNIASPTFFYNEILEGTDGSYFTSWVAARG